VRRFDVERLAAWLSGLWAGILLGIGFIGAPAAFASAPRQIAASVAGRMFEQEAYLSLAMAVVLYLLVRRRARAQAEAGTGSVLSADVLLVLSTLFCTVAGYFAVQPMLDAARLGQGAVSFGALHALSVVMFAIKGLVVAALAWRLAARQS